MTRLIINVVCVVGVLAHAELGYGQLFERATVLENVRVVDGGGQILDRGTLVIKGGRVVEMGEDVKAPFLSSKHDLTGRTITPGLIDAWSTLGLESASADSHELSHAWDDFNPYAGDIFKEALRNGVTTFYLSPGRSPGINGVGCVVKLTANDDGGMGSLIVKDAALSISFGPGNSPIKRLKTFEEVRKKFRGALDYRESLEDYEEELEEYLEKLEVRRKDKEDAEKEGDEKVEGDKKDAGSEGGETKDSPKPEPAPKPEDEKPDGKVRMASSTQSPFAGDDESGDKEKNDEGEKDKKEEELTKPTKPSIDRVSDLLLRAIDHKLGVRILAQRSDGIINALLLAEEFNLDLTIEGATEAYLVASAIAEADVNLIVGQVSRSGLFRPNQFRRYREDQVAALENASIRWTVSSGGRRDLWTRFVSLNAQLAASQLDGVDWLSLVTKRAAKLIGVSRAGFVRRGQSADLVVWSSDPSDPSAVVESVYVAGQLVFDRNNDVDGGGQ